MPVESYYFNWQELYALNVLEIGNAKNDDSSNMFPDRGFCVIGQRSLQKFKIVSRLSIDRLVAPWVKLKKVKNKNGSELKTGQKRIMSF